MFVTSAKQGKVYMIQSVRLAVYWLDVSKFCEILWRNSSWPKVELIVFCWQSG